MEDTLCALFASQKYKCTHVKKKKICKEHSFFFIVQADLGHFQTKNLFSKDTFVFSI